MLTVDALRLIIEPPVAVAVKNGAPGRDHATESWLGRDAAGAALSTLGVDAPDLSDGPDGPVWPDGTIGSIAHTTGTAVAVAARAHERTALGIDIERSDRRVSPRVMERISTPAEKEWLSAHRDAVMPLVLFCAKEATYKAFSRFRSHPVSFADVTFEPPTSDRLAGRVEPSAAPFTPMPEVTVRTVISDSFVVAFVELLSRSSWDLSTRAGTEHASRGSH